MVRSNTLFPLFFFFFFPRFPFSATHLIYLNFHFFLSISSLSLHSSMPIRTLLSLFSPLFLINIPYPLQKFRFRLTLFSFHLMFTHNFYLYVFFIPICPLPLSLRLYSFTLQPTPPPLQFTFSSLQSTSPPLQFTPPPLQSTSSSLQLTPSPLQPTSKLHPRPHSLQTSFFELEKVNIKYKKHNTNIESVKPSERLLFILFVKKKGEKPRKRNEIMS